MKKVLFLTFILVMMITIMYATEENYSDYVIVNQYNEAAQLAEFTGKPLMILFSMATCKDCEEFKKNTLTNDDVIEFLKERFIVVDVQPYPHLRGDFPLSVDNPETFSYSELFRKYGIKRTPTAVFLDKNFDYVNRTTGPYSSEFFIETVKAFDKMFAYTALNDLRLVTEDMALLLLNTLPNARVIDFDKVDLVYDDLDSLDYYIVENGNFHAVQELLQQRGNRLKNVYVLESDLDYTPRETVKEEEVVPQETGNWTNVNAKQAKQVIAENVENDAFYIIDVRTPDEYNDGHIENSINVDFFSADFRERLSEYDKTSTYLVLCQSGGRSGKAVKIMEELGFEFIYHYEGGYADWQEDK